MGTNKPRQPIWANLIHLSYNMWFDCPESLFKNKTNDAVAKPYLRFDNRLWRDILRAMSEAGMNMVVLDLGDAVAYRSHPEIAVKNAWTPARLKKEIASARDLGIEIVPKLNFAAAHDTGWACTRSSPRVLPRSTDRRGLRFRRLAFHPAWTRKPPSTRFTTA